MKSKLSNKIQKQVLLGFISLLIIFFLTAFLQWQALHGATLQSSIFSKITQLQQKVADILDKGKYYKKNAPRDFESYNRDVALFYNDIIKQINIVTEDFEVILSQVGDEPLSNTLYRSFSRDMKKDIEMGGSLLTEWNILINDFHAALGKDKRNPRLEWGADFLIKQIPLFTEKLSDWIVEHEKLQQRKASHLDKTIVTLLVIATLLSLFGIIWIYQKLLKRVRKTAMACKRVADGEFGYQIPTGKQHDEIGQLVDAFNHLSYKTQGVFELLEHLAQAKSDQDMITAITKQQNFTSCSWLGLMKLSSDKGELQLLSTNQEGNLSGWNFKRILLGKGLFASSIETALISKESLIINNVPQISIEDPHARFLRSMLMRTLCNALAVVPLVISGRTVGALALGRRDRTWSKEELQLLENLSELIASRLLLINPEEPCEPDKPVDENINKLATA